MACSIDGSVKMCRIEPINKSGLPLGVAQIKTINYVGLIRPQNILRRTKLSQPFCQVSCHVTCHISCHVTCHVISFYDKANHDKILGASSAERLGVAFSYQYHRIYHCIKILLSLIPSLRFRISYCNLCHFTFLE